MSYPGSGKRKLRKTASAIASRHTVSWISSFCSATASSRRSNLRRSSFTTALRLAAELDATRKRNKACLGVYAGSAATIPSYLVKPVSVIVGGSTPTDFAEAGAQQIAYNLLDSSGVGSVIMNRSQGSLITRIGAEADG